jgi:hypothetical protein
MLPGVALEVLLMLYFNDFRRKFLLVSFFLVYFSLSGIAQGSEVKFSWLPNSETDLAGYKIHYGLVSENYTNVVDVANPAVENGRIRVALSGFTPGKTYYFAATAYNNSGLESDFSSEIVWECPEPEPEFTIEQGTVQADSDWLRVTFNQTFIDPVVVAKPASNGDVDPCVVQIRNVDYSGFEVRLENWSYLAYEHASEMVGFVVVERGSFELPNGSLVAAGYFTSNKMTSYENVVFSQSFNQVPVVMAGAVTVNEDEPVVGRLRNISVSGFNFRMQEQELNVQEHDFERVAYIAWEPGSGMVDNLLFEIGRTGDAVTHAWYAIDFSVGFVADPVLLADMQSTDGADTANLRYNDLTVAGVEIKVSEEQSKNSEVAHTTENVGFMVFERVDVNADSDNDGLSFADESQFYLMDS